MQIKNLIRLGLLFTFLFGGFYSSENLLPSIQEEKNIVEIASPAYDFSFKKLFSDKDILKEFLNALYYPEGSDEKITYVEPMDDYSIKGNSKHIYFDICCECTVQDRVGETHLVDIEMQRIALSYYFNRITLYGCRLFSGQDEKDYDKLKPVKVVSFLNQNLDNNEGWLFKNIIARESGNGSLSKLSKPLLEWTFIQLPKFSEDDVDMNNKLNQWVSLMNIEHVGIKKTQYIYKIDKGKYTDNCVNSGIKILQEIKDNLKYREDVDETTAIRNEIDKEKINITKEAQKQVENLKLEKERLIRELEELKRKYEQKPESEQKNGNAKKSKLN